MIPGYKGNFSFAYCKGNILKCSNPGGELKMESLKNKSRALDILERDETNKLTDAGKEKTESETFRLWFGQRQYWMQSCILAGASGSSWPSFFPCVWMHPCSWRRRGRQQAALRVCLKERAKGKRAGRGDNSWIREKLSQSRGPAHLMKLHKYNRQNTLPLFLYSLCKCVLLWESAHIHKHTLKSYLYSKVSLLSWYSMETCHVALQPHTNTLWLITLAGGCIWVNPNATMTPAGQPRPHVTIWPGWN